MPVGKSAGPAGWAMTDAGPLGYESRGRPPRLPWRAIAGVVLVWLGTVPFTVRYVAAASPLGPMVDGPSPGYEACYAYGLAGGCVERQMRHRQSAAAVGWECRVVTRADVDELLAGHVWPTSTTAVPLSLAVFVPYGWWAVRLAAAGRGTTGPPG